MRASLTKQYMLNNYIFLNSTKCLFYFLLKISIIFSFGKVQEVASYVQLLDHGMANTPDRGVS